MAGDERRRRGGEADAEKRLRLRLRGITVAVILVLLVFRVMVLPMVGLITGATIDDDGITIGTLIGAALLLAGIEVPSLLSNIRAGPAPKEDE